MLHYKAAAALESQFRIHNVQISALPNKDGEEDLGLFFCRNSSPENSKEQTPYKKTPYKTSTIFTFLLLDPSIQATRHALITGAECRTCMDKVENDEQAKECEGT